MRGIIHEYYFLVAYQSSQVLARRNSIPQQNAFPNSVRQEITSSLISINVISTVSAANKFVHRNSYQWGYRKFYFLQLLLIDHPIRSQRQPVKCENRSHVAFQILRVILRFDW